MKKLVLVLALLAALPAAQARDFTSEISESAEIPRLRPEFKVPDEPDQLFYVQRSPNSNTVIYAAKLDAQGNLNSSAPVEAFWRKFNIDGSKQPLNFIERHDGLWREAGRSQSRPARHLQHRRPARAQADRLRWMASTSPRR